ncbi:MAG: hypothetical protein CMO34_06875 [Verrucomicrobia bacterium]|nr:hypothetical protein [Verrucomicrobiota bacterium]|tara:strand:+ start:781 stop:1515 length:735 start_codon:yes stop_codon:yes gene_type:complete
MKWIRGLLGIVWKFYFLGVFFITLLLLYPAYIPLLTKEKYFRAGFQLIRFHARLILLLVGIRKKVMGSIPNDDSTTYLICPNHSSYLDILLLYAAFPNYFIFLGKVELGKVPIFNIFFKKMNLLVDRKNPKAAHQSILNACKVLEKGSNLVIFPEGTIPRNTPQLKGFKNGAFRIAQQLNIPIVPVTFKDNYKLLEDSWSFRARNRPGISRIYIHEPVFPQKENQTELIHLREETRARIASKID